MVRTDDLPFARSAADLVAGRHLYPLRFSEAGIDLKNINVRTGANTSGAAVRTCNDWTVARLTLGTFGYAHGENSLFSNAGATACSVPMQLYCFGIDRVAPIAAPRPASGSKAFVSSTFDPILGLGGADALCTSDASTAGLTGTFKAYMATTTASATSRFTSTAVNFVRTDGIPVGSVATVLAATSVFTAPLSVAADGVTHFGNTAMWVGATTGSALGTALTTCSNWSTNTSAFTGSTGLAGSGYGPQFINVSTAKCSNTTAFRLYCLQN